MVKETTALKDISTDALIAELRSREDIIALKIWKPEDVVICLRENQRFSKKKAEKIGKVICDTTDFSVMGDCDDADWELLRDMIEMALEEV